MNMLRHLRTVVQALRTGLLLFNKADVALVRDYVIGKVPTLQNDPRGRQIIELLQSERIERLPSAALEPIRQLMREHEDLSARYAVSMGKP